MEKMASNLLVLNGGLVVQLDAILQCHEDTECETGNFLARVFRGFEKVPSYPLHPAVSLREPESRMTFR